MINLEVNGKKVTIDKDKTVLSAIQEAGFSVPTLCHMKDLFPAGACRICVVEAEGQGNLLPSCSFPASEGMKILTHSPKVHRARKTIVELMLASHPQDCLYCARHSDCELSALAHEYGVAERVFPAVTKKAAVDCSSAAITRDSNKCILCGKCVRTCEEVQEVGALDYIQRGSNTVVGCAFNTDLGESSCINCGQCVKACPTGALVEKRYINEVLEALSDPNMHVVVQHAPAVSVSIGEMMGLEPGIDADGKMVAALRKVGFDRVFDTSFTADLTIMEEGSELVERVKKGGVLPMMTSCSPGWIKFVEQFYPELMPNLSTCKSPQQMMGAIIKEFYAPRHELDPKKVFSVSIMPCTAKKFEALRPEMGRNGYRDVDAVLTTRELAQLFKTLGVDFAQLAPEVADSPFGDHSTAGKLFGVTGGVMEAAVRSAHFLITGKEAPKLVYDEVRGLKGVKTAIVPIGDLNVSVAVVSGLGQARKLLAKVRSGEINLHFIEVMTCPGGCINGGGQPMQGDEKAVNARMNRLYSLDEESSLRRSHENPEVHRLYKEFLGAPLGHKSHSLLHTHYDQRDVLR